MRVAALDIGGTAIKHGVWDGARLFDFGECPSTAREGSRVLMEQVKAILYEMQPFDAIGVSTAGEVDTRTGRICSANGNIPGYLGMGVANMLRTAFNVPVAVENDANAAAVGERYYGAMRGKTDFLYVCYGTGVGGAVMLNGALYPGNAFSAGSFGGMVTHPEHLDPGNLMAGRYESYASTGALVRNVQRIDPRIDNGRAVFAESGNPAVWAEICAWVREVAIGLVSLIYAFSPASIVLGGGVMQQSGLVQSIYADVRKFTEPRFEGVDIVGTQLGNVAGVLGAAHLAQQLLRGLPKGP